MKVRKTIKRNGKTFYLVGVITGRHAAQRRADLIRLRSTRSKKCQARCVPVKGGSFGLTNQWAVYEREEKI